MRDIQLAGAWLARHGLVDTGPTPALAARLKARMVARLADSVLLAVLIIAAALTQAHQMLADPAPRLLTPSPVPVLALASLVVGVLVVRSLLDRWVRGVDRRAAAGLVRRATHAVPPGWRTVVGVPYAAFTAATATGALVLTLSAFAVDDPAVRRAAVVLLVGVCGVVAGTAIQIRHLLTRPVVAEDEDSLTADVIMRIEDAREATSPGVLWSLPVVVLFGTAPTWWSAASLILVVVGLIALVAVNARAPRVGVTARQAASR